MKKILLCGVIGLLLFVGCGKKGDIACSGKITDGGKNFDVTYYGYLSGDKVTRIDADMKFDSQDDANTVCSQLKQSVGSIGISISCSGKTVTLEHYEKLTDKEISKSEFIKGLEEEGLTCK